MVNGTGVCMFSIPSSTSTLQYLTWNYMYKDKAMKPKVCNRLAR